MITDFKKIHFVGIKGVGMASLAVIAKQAGAYVSGSDVSESFITDEMLDKNGIFVSVDFDPARVENVDLVITTGAHGGYSNPEVQKANELGIPVLTQGEAVGKIMDGELFFSKKPYGISVAGSHGKTTTTSMIATLLTSAGLDPSYLIGTSTIPTLNGPGHLGKGKYLVVEADEYATEPNVNKKAKLLWQHPTMIVLTNIDFDHPDIYESLNSIKSVFSEFISSLPEDGALVTCGDDEHIQELIARTNKRVITYGFSPKNIYHNTHVTIEDEQMFFAVEKGGVSIGEFMVKITGKHNALNATAAIAVGMELGIAIPAIQKGLSDFKGSKRRMEFVGTLSSGALVYDDYAHHPKEIKETLKAFKHMFPRKTLIVFFQPHTFSRTKHLFNDFISAFDDADTVGIMDIFASMREERDDTVSSEKLVFGILQRKRDVLYLPEAGDVLKYIDQHRPSTQSVIVFMGAGDIYKIPSTLSLT